MKRQSKLHANIFSGHRQRCVFFSSEIEKEEKEGNMFFYCSCNWEQRSPSPYAFRKNRKEEKASFANAQLHGHTSELSTLHNSSALSLSLYLLFPLSLFIHLFIYFSNCHHTSRSAMVVGSVV
jgi:hypothetical protein